MPRITCTGSPERGGCGTVLVHPPSASFVRCAVCSAITPCRPISSSSMMMGNDHEDGRGTSSFFPSSSALDVSFTSSSRGGVAGGFGGRVGAEPREMGAIQCRGCAVRLMFDLDATQVHCALCRTVNRVAGFNNGGSAQRQDVSHCQCRGCGVTLMYTRGATSVSCGACHAITNTAGIVAAGEGERWSKAGGVGEEERELVVVENPPVKLRDGRVMPNVSVAVEIHSNK